MDQVFSPQSSHTAFNYNWTEVSVLITMFKFSLCFATLAGLIFLLKGDDKEKPEKSRKNNKVLNQDFDSDEYEDYEDYDYSDIDVDDLDYDTLKEIEETLNNMG